MSIFTPYAILGTFDPPPRYINSLQSNFTSEDATWQLLQRQFNQITAKKPLETHFKVRIRKIKNLVMADDENVDNPLNS